jgi:hypothetical protein
VGNPDLARPDILSDVGVEAPILVDLILSGDQDAVAGFYDGRAPSVYAYCAEVCRGEQVEGAVLASFADFLGRVRADGVNADVDELLRKSTRTAAASRMRVANSRDATCRSMPELIAARANGELPHDEGPIKAHLEGCRSCRRVAQQLVDAEDALAGPASRQPPEEIRSAWLLIASGGTGPRAAEPPPAASEPEREPEPAPEPEREPGPEPESNAGSQSWLPPSAAQSSEAPAEPPAAPQAAPAPEYTAPLEPPLKPPATPERVASPEPLAPQPVTVRRRRGGLIGAARRAVSSTRRH